MIATDGQRLRSEVVGYCSFIFVWYLSGYSIM